MRAAYSNAHPPTDDTLPEPTTTVDEQYPVEEAMTMGAAGKDSAEEAAAPGGEMEEKTKDCCGPWAYCCSMLTFCCVLPFAICKRK